MADCGLSPFGSTTHLGTAFHSCFAAGIFTPLVTHVQQTQLNHIHLVLTSNPYMSSELGSPFLRMLCSPPSFEVYEPCGVANRSAHRTLSTILALASTKQHAFVAHVEENHLDFPLDRGCWSHCRLLRRPHNGTYQVSMVLATCPKTYPWRKRLGCQSLL